jgi:hypothetical protein
MTNVVRERLIDYFWESISEMQWDVWCDTSSTDKERIAVDAMVELGLSEDVEEVFDLFWEWADGLEEDSFFDFDSFNNED